MKLDRNKNANGTGKYALLNLRNIPLFNKQEINDAIEVLKSNHVLTFGNESPGEQFFVMKHKDKFTAPALVAYANAVAEFCSALPENDPLRSELNEFGAEVLAEARAASNIPHKIPS